MHNDSAQLRLKPEFLGVSEILFFVIFSVAPLAANPDAGTVVFAMVGAGTRTST